MSVVVELVGGPKDGVRLAVQDLYPKIVFPAMPKPTMAYLEPEGSGLDWVVKVEHLVYVGPYYHPDRGHVQYRLEGMK